MNKNTEQKFINVFKICESLVEIKGKPTNMTFTAITLLCDIAQNPNEFKKLCQKYAKEIKQSNKYIDEYATSIDNGRVDCALGFGLKDHCSFISFFLNFYSGEIQYFTGNFTHWEIIAELFKDYNNINLLYPAEKIALVS